jgi:hypothetical protein
MAALHSYAETALERVAAGGGRAYDPNDEQDEELPYLTADRDELLDTALLDCLQHGSSLPVISPDELQKRRLALYALLLGDDPGRQTIFVRRGSPVSLASKGLVALFDEALTRIRQPILAFDDRFDLVIYPNAAHIFNQKNFEALFKESEAVLAKTSEWAGTLNKAIPMAAGGEEYLAERLRKNSNLRRKVQSILKAPYLGQLTPRVLKKQMVASGLDPSRLLDNGTLIFEKNTEHDILLLLNEDLWTGSFSQQRYAASRKARLTDI